MPHHWNTRLVTVSVAALCLGLAGCGGGDEETSAEDTGASTNGAVQTSNETQDQNAGVANESAVDSTESMESSANTAAVEDGLQENVAATNLPAPSDSEDSAIEYASLSGDPVKGKRVFVKCMSCHATVVGQNRVGPSLYGIVGKSAGAVENFKYSPAMKDSGVVWDDEALHGYLNDPKGFMPGNRMMFPGVASAQDRSDLIAYLKTTLE